MLPIDSASSAAMAAFHRLFSQLFSVPPLSQSAMMNLSTSPPPPSAITISQSSHPIYHYHNHQQTWSPKSSHLVETKSHLHRPRWTIGKMPSHFFLLLLLLVLATTTTTVQCRSHRVAFDLQELTHDSPVMLDPENVVELELRRGESLEYVLDAHLLLNQTLRLYLTKPYKVRKAEALDNLESLVVVNADHQRTPLIRFSKGNANHRGYYHLYRFVYDLEGRLVNYDRTDFHVRVVGLYPEMHQRISDDQCDSGHSVFGFCVCQNDFPVYNNNNNTCLPARDQNETCEIEPQCQEFGGSEAECYFGRCRCKQDTVPVKISQDERTCVRPAQLHHSCLYSMQCSLEGENRFCNEHYRCECLPGHSLEDGRYCSSGAGRFCSRSADTALLLLVLLAFTTLIVYL